MRAAPAQLHPFLVNYSTRLYGKNLLFVRTLWASLCILFISLFLLGAPAAYQSALALSDVTRSQLVERGISPEFPAYYLITLDTVIATLIVVAAFTPIKDTLHKIAERRFQDPDKPEEKLKAFAELVETRVSPLYAPQITRRLLTKAIAAFDATGGAAFLDHKGETKMLESVGIWQGVAAMCVAIENITGTERYGWVALDDRKDGAPYSDEEFKALQDLAYQIADALQEDALDRD